MLGENPVHPLHALIALGIVENLVQCKGRKPPNYVREVEFPTTIDETIDERHGSVSYGQWFMRVLGFQVHVCLSGCRVFHVVEFGGPGPSVLLAIQGVPC